MITVQANIGEQLLAEWKAARKAAGLRDFESTLPWTFGAILETELAIDLERCQKVAAANSVRSPSVSSVVEKS
jgi:hypothetical protein